MSHLASLIARVTSASNIELMWFGVPASPVTYEMGAVTDTHTYYVSEVRDGTFELTVTTGFPLLGSCPTEVSPGHKTAELAKAVARLHALLVPHGVAPLDKVTELTYALLPSPQDH